MLPTSSLSDSPYALNSNEGIGRRAHDLELIRKGDRASEEDVKEWMRAEIAADPHFTMPGVVSRAAELLGPCHRLVVEETLGPLFVEARNNTVCHQ